MFELRHIYLFFILW